MEKIILQPGVKQDNQWVSEFIKIADCWESSSNEYNAVISGFITPYGIDINLKVKIKESRLIELSIAKHLENVKSGFSSKVFPYSEIIELKVNFKDFNSKNRILVLGKSLCNRLSFLIKGLKPNFSSDDYLVYSDNFGINRDKLINEMLLIKDLYKLELNNGDFYSKIIAIPIDKNEIQDFLDKWMRIINNVH